MTGFQLQRLGEVMKPIPGDPLEAEGVLIRLPFVGLTASCTYSHASSRETTIHGSV